MKITCEHCQKKYIVDLKNIKKQRAKFVCKACSKIIVVENPFFEPDIVDIETREIRSENVIKVTSRIRWVDRIQVRINAIVAIVIIVIMGSYAGMQYHLADTRMKLEINTSAMILVERLSNQLVEPFWALDDEILQKSLKSEMLDKNVFAINLIDRDGKKLYMGYKRNNRWQPIENNQPIQEYTTKKERFITRDQKQIGSVEVFLTPRFGEEELRMSMKKIGITAALLVMVVFMSIFLITRTMIVQPIRNLTNLADQISLGHLDTKIPMGSNNEIGLLAKAFHRMKTSIVLVLERLEKV